jgi:uncharacterized Zn finger protein
MAENFGLTWWGQRWIAALEALGREYANRLPRGRTYARSGAVTDLVIRAGKVTARVAGRRPTPYRVSIDIPVFNDPQWTAAAHALARQLRHSAALLDGRMPEDIDATLDVVGLSLFPGPRDLSTKCTCPDIANPCKHVAAVHYTLARSFDTDPFLLPTLRGRDRAALLAAIRAVRSGRTEPAPADAYGDEGGLAISAITARTLFDGSDQLAAIAIHPQETLDTGAALRRLGPPPGFDSLADLEDLVVGAAAQAWQLAQHHDDEQDPLLALLMERGAATATELADALDRPVGEIRLALRRLIADGVLYRTGHARSTRYHV